MNRRARSVRLTLATAAVLAFGAAAAPCASAAVTLDDILGILNTNGIAVDTPDIQSNAVNALLRAIDPEARILSAADAARVEKENAGEADLCAATNAGAANAGPVEPLLTPASRPTEFWPRGIAYIKVHGLFEDAGAALTNQLALAATGAVTGLILDLRGAGGADVKSAATVAGQFGKPGEPLFSIQDLRGRVLETYAAQPALSFDFPVMALVDAKTAQAAALLATLLETVPQAMVVGTPPGSNVVLREMLPLPDGQRLYLATRRVVPARAPAAGEGLVLVPDVSEWAQPEAPEPAMNTGGKPLSNEARADKKLLERIGNDGVLRRAVDLLLGLKALGVSIRDGTPHATR